MLGLLLAGTAVVAGAVIFGVLSSATRHTRHQPDDPPDRVVVGVSGTAIRQSDIDRAIPPNLFGVTRRRAEKQRLTQLVRNMLIRKFLDEKGVVVAEDAVSLDFDQVRRTPSSGGCPYCAPAATFEDMLWINFYTEDDVKNEIRNRLGLAQYLEKYWDAEGHKAGRPKGELLNEQLSVILLTTGAQVNAAVREWEKKQQPAAKKE